MEVGAIIVAVSGHCGDVVRWSGGGGGGGCLWPS